MYKDNKEMKSLEIRIRRSKGKLTKIQMRLHEIKNLYNHRNNQQNEEAT